MKLNKQQTEAIQLIDRFLKDPDAFDMFITGQAGCGKTTLLHEVVRLLQAKNFPHVVCAYTHKAKEVLISKLPPNSDVRTLHSFLRKRPSINEEARSVRNLQTTLVMGKPEPVKLLIVDEFSMVGERDVLSIGELQDPDYTGKPQVKVLYIGDPLQLQPVGDTVTLDPGSCEYHYHLTQVIRQADGSSLLDTITQVVDILNGAPLTRLEPHDTFIRTDDRDAALSHIDEDTAVLAYTNKRVEELNLIIAQTHPDNGDRWCPTLRSDLTIDEKEPILSITTHAGELCLGSKYNTLEFLLKMQEIYPQIEIGTFYNQTAEEKQNIAFVHGHYQYKILHEQLAQAAAESNAVIDAPSPRSFCMKNPHNPLCRKRAKAWREYITFKECVMCIDYPYAQTVHKSQGSTFDTVIVDNSDLSMVLKRGDTMTYLRLLYVALSRASNKAIMIDSHG